MKNLFLIGDSIRLGYDKAVKKTLEGKANVIFPEENCRFASYVLRYLADYLEVDKGTKVDVIHWNAGLWDTLRMFDEDMFTPLEVYEYYIDRICQRIKKLAPEAKVIFATSTYVLSDKMAPHFKRYNEDTEKYNEAAIKIVKKYGFDVDDLYPVSKNLPEEAHSDAVHYYTPIGTKAFADCVLKSVASHLELDEIPEYAEELHTERPIGT